MKKRLSPFIIFLANMADNSGNQRMLEFVRALAGQNKKIVIMSQKNGELKNEFSRYCAKIFIFKRMSARQLMPLRIFRFVILSDYDLYKTAASLAAAKVSYLWIIQDISQKDKLAAKNRSVMQILSNSKNVIEGFDLEKLIKIIGCE